MITKITVKQMAAAKRVAANVNPLVVKKSKLQDKIAALTKEIDDLNGQIDAQQGYVKSFAGGLTTEQLVTRDEKGTYQPNLNVVLFDEKERVYMIKEQVEAEEAEQAQIAADAAALEKGKEAEQEQAPAEAAADPDNGAGDPVGDQDPSGDSAVKPEKEYDPFAPEA